MGWRLEINKTTNNNPAAILMGSCLGWHIAGSREAQEDRTDMIVSGPEWRVVVSRGEIYTARYGLYLDWDGCYDGGHWII